ncbi:MAG: ribosome-associated translation inhibitor RaiA [Candidatus Pacebacteria bacterium]|nr:ribosome-associated translation inhibitor RaiA [Candidatus Paceibacterota bacterium]
MQVNIQATKLELTDDLRDYIQKKMDMLDKYLTSVAVINCDFEIELESGKGHSGKIYRAEVNLEVPGTLLRVEKNAEELFKAIDKVKDHLDLVIKKYKEKKASKQRKARQ